MNRLHVIDRQYTWIATHFRAIVHPLLRWLSTHILDTAWFRGSAARARAATEVLCWIDALSFSLERINRAR